MPEPALMTWILCAPVVLAVIDLVRTWSAIKEGRKSAPAPGPWSNALHVNTPA